jgi:hypothetical protein
MGEAGDPLGTEYAEAESFCSDAERPGSPALACAGFCHGDLSTTTTVRMQVIAAKARAFSQKPPFSEGFFAPE